MGGGEAEKQAGRKNFVMLLERFIFIFIHRSSK
jgi:hypothetical protein